MQYIIKNDVKFGIVSDQMEERLMKDGWEPYEDYRKMFMDLLGIFVTSKYIARKMGLIT